MKSGGALLVASVHNTYSVDVDHAARDVGEPLGRIEPAEGCLCDQQRLPDHGRRVLHLLEPLGRGGLTGLVTFDRISGQWLGRRADVVAIGCLMAALVLVSSARVQEADRQGGG